MSTHDAAAIARRLERSAALVQALLDETNAGTEPLAEAERERRRLVANELLEEADVASATFSVSTYTPRLVNAVWRELFGAEARNRPTAGLPDEATRHFAEVMQQGRMRHLPALELSEPGRLRYCAATIAPLRGASGAAIGVIVSCLDVTDVVIARALEVPVGSLIWAGDSSGATAHTSLDWYNYTGLPWGSSWVTPIHADDRERCAVACGEAQRLQTPMHVEVRIYRGDGSFRWHTVRFASARADRCQLAAAIEIYDDARTERSELANRERAARDEAELANRLKDQFFATVSHELRAPLTTMLLWERILRDAGADESLRATALDAIHQSAMLQARLVADLVDVARASSGKLYIDVRPVQLRYLLDQAIGAAAAAFATKQIALETRFDTSVGLIDGDGVRLRQVFDNLLANALKFTEPGGQVIVSTRRLRKVVAIDIADTGCGIPEDFLPRLFDPFSQHLERLTRPEGGLGLGLTIARELVTLHQGTLEAASPGVGLGTTFTVTLPATRRTRAPTPIPHLPGRPLEELRLLVLEDDQRVREALALLLTRAGAVVEAAASADAARALIVQRIFDVLVCDIAMPAEDGYQFLRQLRSSGSTTPAIALTAYASAADAQKARDAGFAAHLAKPVDFERLVESVHAAIVGTHAS
ncbi:MAG: ATP-binding protein [Deltaproteobacteria bacterium]